MLWNHVFLCAIRFPFEAFPKLQTLRHSFEAFVPSHSLQSGRGYAPDEALAAKLRTFHHDMDAERARRLGMVGAPRRGATVKGDCRLAIRAKGKGQGT